MPNNAIIISTQSPQSINPLMVPKVGELMWFVVVDDGVTYKPTQLCIANSDRWSDPIDLPGGGGGGGSVTSVAGRTGAVTLTKNDVGLSNVNNTSDAEKPVSNATQFTINSITASSIGAQPASAKLTTLAGLSGTLPIRADGTTSATAISEVTGLQGKLNEVSMIGTAYTNTSAANAAAVITVPSPGAGLSLQLNQLTFSYSAAPTNALLTIQQGGTTIHETAITSAGAGPTIAGYKLTANTALTITLSAGGAGVIGRVSASVATV
jgi:hypothetical protein